MTTLDRLILPRLKTSKARFETVGGISLSGTDISERSHKLSEELRAQGVTAQEPVLLMVSSDPEDLVGYLAIWEAGAVAVPCHVTAVEATISALRVRLGIRFEVHSGSLRQIEAKEPPPRPELEKAAIIVFTSGSTGKPKGVVIGHHGMAHKLAVLTDLLNFTSKDVVLCPLQLTFIFGIWVALLGALCGSRVVLIKKFSSGALSDALGAATRLASVPTMLRAMVDLETPAAPKLTSILTGGEALGTALAQKLYAQFPNAQIFDLYGSTETGSCDFCLSPDLQPSGYGTIGRPTPGVTFRIEGVGDYSSPGEGELQICTPSRMLGYLDDPELTARAFAGEYFRTGDLVRVREDGLVELVGRLKEIISRGGNKIAPLEIDNVFARHPEVGAALSFGVPDARLGECLHVLIVRKDGSALTADELREWACVHLEKFKLPDRIHFVATIPLGATGKIDRRAAAASIA